ncbi:hypothetical protein H0H93_008574 [Arthromyces matolae]|nr:hypothetical protein H0H93_008574 [Arthromyces matolae]
MSATWSALLPQFFLIILVSPYKPSSGQSPLPFQSSLPSNMSMESTNAILPIASTSSGIPQDIIDAINNYDEAKGDVDPLVLETVVQIVLGISDKQDSLKQEANPVAISPEFVPVSGSNETNASNPYWHLVQGSANSRQGF